MSFEIKKKVMCFESFLLFDQCIYCLTLTRVESPASIFLSYIFFLVFSAYSSNIVVVLYL